MKILVGYTGFVGSNINKSYKFDGLFNSKNIQEAFGTNPDLLVYSGVRAEKFLANKEPEKDMEIIEDAIENIKKINPKKLVLISTVDIYKNAVDVDENTEIHTKELQPYGLNRYYLEKWVQENIKDYIIVRLPGLYGENIKKNYIYDMINVIPSMLNEAKFSELNAADKLISEYYFKQDNGFYKCKDVTSEEKAFLKEYFTKAGFSALNFTDSRGSFQFYNLAYLWKHIQIAMENNIKVLNLATEPVTVSEIYQYIKGKEFINEVAKVVPYYDFKTNYAPLFNGKNGYIFNKEFILKDIAEFVGGRS
jgi:hypothetical protein